MPHMRQRANYFLSGSSKESKKDAKKVARKGGKNKGTTSGPKSPPLVHDLSPPPRDCSPEVCFYPRSLPVWEARDSRKCPSVGDSTSAPRCAP